jgi:alkyl sulfatase BDS1-like metallo-beta-lactamase superfamily hydrolase
MGWYDGNPANLHALPPVPAAKKYVEYMGGEAAVLTRARADYGKGEYRWVAQVASQLVFADPANRAARELAADAFEQLGYQAESGTWRSAYLQGALELRQGVAAAVGTTTASPARTSSSRTVPRSRSTRAAPVGWSRCIGGSLPRARCRSGCATTLTRACKTRATG